MLDKRYPGPTLILRRTLPNGGPPHANGLNSQEW
jgi:hypothetical protein